MAISTLSWREALEAVKSARTCVCPNFGFQEQLRDFEEAGLEKVCQSI